METGRLIGIIFCFGDASRRVMEKCGMTFCRTAEKEVFYLGEERDLIYYKVTV